LHLNTFNTHTHTHIYTHTLGRTPLDERLLPDNTQHSQETDIHSPGGIRTLNPSKRAAADPRSGIYACSPVGHIFYTCAFLTELQNFLTNNSVYQSIKTEQIFYLFRKIAVSVTAWKQNSSFLGVFAKLRKATVRCVSLCLCVRPHGTTRLPLDGFS
jgi:hypothetical protein